MTFSARFYRPGKPTTAHHEECVHRVFETFSDFQEPTSFESLPCFVDASNILKGLPVLPLRMRVARLLPKESTPPPCPMRRKTKNHNAKRSTSSLIAGKSAPPTGGVRHHEAVPSWHLRQPQSGRSYLGQADGHQAYTIFRCSALFTASTSTDRYQDYTEHLVIAEVVKETLQLTSGLAFTRWQRYRVNSNKATNSNTKAIIRGVFHLQAAF